MKKETIVISVGGSLIVPDKIDVNFLKKFRTLILKHIKKGKRFILITGGGRTARNYQEAAKSIVKLHHEDLDWIGIHATRMNAHLMRTIFRNYSRHKIVKNPNEKIRLNKDDKIIVAAGWKPGFSTDYDAVLIAKQLGAKKVINLSNINYVYDKDPKKFRNARKIKQIEWKDFRKIVGNKWDPGLNAPFDPVASKEAEKLKMEVIIANGKKLNNLDKILSGKKFIGTTIS